MTKTLTAAELLACIDQFLAERDARVEARVREDVAVALEEFATVASTPSRVGFAYLTAARIARVGVA